jgi:hypothetical protein
MVISLLAMAVSVTGVTGVHRGWFHRAEKPTLSSSADKQTADADAAAAARHVAGQPRHWRYLMLQQHQ